MSRNKLTIAITDQLWIAANVERGGKNSLLDAGMFSYTAECLLIVKIKILD
ncbi:MAG: hypothetical protein BroJett005_18940 [Ignavibacteriota bacterium]|jgi:hypothetical protein|nr:MAG: hypothetical protein BroJett005_18940 [Ignavibacteriota bacterium]